MEEIQFIEKGESKNCLLLIHGFCSGPEDWEDQIKFFLVWPYFMFLN
jgi:hypothetical protein